MTIDCADRLTPLSVLVLAVLREGDMHPYEMIRLMRQRHDDRLASITNGTVYHTVARLQKLGLLAELGVDREGNRPERTTYTLTGDGRAIVSEWVRRELPRIDRPDQFRVALAEAHNLDRAEVLELLQRRRLALRQQHDYHQLGRLKAAERAVPEQYLVEVERQAALLTADLHWLDSLIHQLAADEIAWGPREAAHA
ncbi:PadR family transcriptional regulator [Micropruina sp.]|uniref:PadR family transcriptional regulator n=1 Tax=Micropruina sp. TaxID=2737536 RepID=UPI0039E25C07